MTLRGSKQDRPGALLQPWTCLPGQARRGACGGERSSLRLPCSGHAAGQGARTGPSTACPRGPWEGRTGGAFSTREAPIQRCSEASRGARLPQGLRGRQAAAWADLGSALAQAAAGRGWPGSGGHPIPWLWHTGGVARSPGPPCSSRPQGQTHSVPAGAWCRLHPDLHGKTRLCGVSRATRFYHAVNTLLLRAISIKPTARLSVSV